MTEPAYFSDLQGGSWIPTSSALSAVSPSPSSTVTLKARLSPLSFADSTSCVYGKSARVNQLGDLLPIELLSAQPRRGAWGSRRIPQYSEPRCREPTMNAQLGDL